MPPAYTGTSGVGTMRQVKGNYAGYLVPQIVRFLKAPRQALGTGFMLPIPVV